MTEKTAFHQILLILIVLVSGFCLPAFAQDATIPGEVTTPYPTITNLAVEWLINGDDNLNCVAKVEYRMAGEKKWREAMPLRRVPADRGITTRGNFIWLNKLSGSRFDLKPDTEYEIRLRLSDPDRYQACAQILPGWADKKG